MAADRGRSLMSPIDPSPTDLPAVSYIRVASAGPDDAARTVEWQRAQIALAAQRLGLRLADELVDIGSELGRVETDERTRLTVSARASVRCRRRPRGARR